MAFVTNVNIKLIKMHPNLYSYYEWIYCWLPLVSELRDFSSFALDIKGCFGLEPHHVAPSEPKVLMSSSTRA